MPNILPSTDSSSLGNPSRPFTMLYAEGVATNNVQFQDGAVLSITLNAENQPVLTVKVGEKTYTGTLTEVEGD